MLSYATEETKGRYIALFWVVFNTGAVIGSIIPVARNWNSTAGAVDVGLPCVVTRLHG